MAAPLNTQSMYHGVDGSTRHYVCPGGVSTPGRGSWCSTRTMRLDDRSQAERARRSAKLGGPGPVCCLRCFRGRRSEENQPPLAGMSPPVTGAGRARLRGGHWPRHRPRHSPRHGADPGRGPDRDVHSTPQHPQPRHSGAHMQLHTANHRPHTAT